ncbi:FliH/SctL family protein [Buchnera aphidicola]|uniref:FliH/SctL family protein n=1 Tax=Buchnera aphidicola TaxID=9 RepID=UPI00094CCBB1|nr:FliH/SctL family protein [Buchnera aphidicola]
MKKNIDLDIWKKWQPNLFSKRFRVFDSDNTKGSQKLFPAFTAEKKKNNETNTYSQIYKKGYDRGLKKGYQQGYQIGWLQCFSWSENPSLEKHISLIYLQYASVLKKFKSAIYDFSSIFSQHLMRVVLNISKILIDDLFLINKSYLIKKIEHLVRQSRYAFQKLQLHVHPKNYHIINKNFGTLMGSYGWTIILDKNIDVNSYRVITEEGEVDSTLQSFWKNVHNIANLSD